MKLQNEHDVVNNLADQIAKKITRKTISVLQKMRDKASGCDSELTTIWDHICVQVHMGESLLWQAYDFTIRQHVIGYVEALEDFEKLSLWLQTDEAIEWIYADDMEENPDRIPPIDENEIANYIITSYLYQKADEWTNIKIRRYMERYYDSGEY